MKDNQEIINQAEMIQGEINRMCVTDDPSELMRMCNFALRNILKLEDMNMERLKDGRQKRKSISL